MGPSLFFGVWVVYGYCAGLLLVWLCRKTILAVMLAFMVGAGVLGLWLPSLLCGGMSGWQVWVPPVVGLVACRLLVRAWAGGRIKERGPVMTLTGCGAAVLGWAALTLGYRAFELPDVGAPVDPVAFRAALQAGPENVAGLKLQIAFTAIEDAGAQDERWLPLVAQAVPLPAGMIETPRSDGQMPNLRHLPFVPRMTKRLRALAEAEQAAGRPAAAFDYLAQILAVS